MGKITAPAPLSAAHITDGFRCGNDTLDEWLVKRALKNQDNGASRTFVICEGSRVIGYYALASGSVERLGATSNFARSMPDPIPVIILARLAIDQTYQGQRLGAGLLKNAMLRTLNASTQVGARGMLVHAISEEAKHFYLSYGFQVSPIDEMTLMLSSKNIRKHLELSLLPP